MVGTDAFQETDMIGISRPIVKHSFMIKHPLEIPEVLKKPSTWRNPVALVRSWSIFPKDMTNPAEKLNIIFEKGQAALLQPGGPWPSGQIRKAAEMLLAAKRPTSTPVVA